MNGQHAPWWWDYLFHICVYLVNDAAMHNPLRVALLEDGQLQQWEQHAKCGDDTLRMLTADDQRRRAYNSMCSELARLKAIQSERYMQNVMLRQQQHQAGAYTRPLLAQPKPF